MKLQCYNFGLQMTNTADMWNNCAFKNRDMKLGTLLNPHESKSFWNLKVVLFFD